MKMKIYVGASLKDAKKLMFWAESMDKTQIRMRDIAEWGERVGVVDAEHLSEELYNTLMQWTKGKALTTVHRHKENGAEAWRQLHLQYNPRTMGNKTVIRNRINTPQTNIGDSKIVQVIEAWEEQISKFEEMFNERVSDGEKITLLMTICNEDAMKEAYRFIETDDYETVKNKIIEYTQYREENEEKIKEKWRCQQR